MADALAQKKAECVKLCDGLLADTRRDVLNVKTEVFSKLQMSETKSTVSFIQPRTMLGSGEGCISFQSRNDRKSIGPVRKHLLE